MSSGLEWMPNLTGSPPTSGADEQTDMLQTLNPSQKTYILMGEDAKRLDADAYVPLFSKF